MSYLHTPQKYHPSFSYLFEEHPSQATVPVGVTLGISPMALKTLQCIVDSISRKDRPVEVGFLHGIYKIPFRHSVRAIKELVNTELLAFDTAPFKGRITDETRVVLGEKMKSPRVGRVKANKKTFIYLMRDLDNGSTKIGESSRPGARKGTLKSEGHNVKLLWCFPGKVEDEIELHKMYADKRLPVHPGRTRQPEYFNLSDQDVEDIMIWLQNKRG